MRRQYSLKSGQLRLVMQIKLANCVLITHMQQLLQAVSMRIRQDYLQVAVTMVIEWIRQLRTMNFKPFFVVVMVVVLYGPKIWDAMISHMCLLLSRRLEEQECGRQSRYRLRKLKHWGIFGRLGALTV